MESPNTTTNIASQSFANQYISNANQHPEPSSANDSFVNTLIQELKTIKLSNTNSLLNGSNLVDGLGAIQLLGDSNSNSSCNSSIANQNCGISYKQTQNLMKSSQSANSSQLWSSPQSPTSSIQTQYHSASSHTNSKESLWASTQCSPNGNQPRDQLLRSPQQYINLWENPVSKISQANLMASKEPIDSLWLAPAMQSSPINKITTLWDAPATFNSSPAPFNNVAPAATLGMNKMSSDFQQAAVGGQRLANRQHSNDLTSIKDIWTTPLNNSDASKTVAPVSSLWAQPTPPKSQIVQSSFLNNNKMHNKSPNPIKQSQLLSPVSTFNGNGYSNGTAALSNGTVSRSSTVSSNINSPAAVGSGNPLSNNNNNSSAASSCMQLFSDEFLNYLNMIN